MDLRAVKAASRPERLACAAAAAENAQHLLDDAELLSDAGRHARAYSLAVLAVEEFGKATSLLSLAAMPANLRAQAPVRRMLEWHQLKQIGGLLIAAVTFTEPGAAARVAAQLGRARQVASSASLLRDPGVPAMLADPRAEAIELSRALVSAFAEAGDVRRPKAAAAVALNAVRTLQEHMDTSE